MRFALLGSLEVRTDAGAPVAVPGAQARVLLVALLLGEGRPVPADRLIRNLWGDDPPRKPGAALQVRVSQLRRALEDAEPGARELVVSRPPGYLLDVPAEAVDTRRFAALLDSARAADGPQAAQALLTEALNLWRGEALAGFADAEFATAAVARLHEQRLTAIEESAQSRLELGEHTRLADELADTVARHPFRERLRGLHMRALYRAGRQREALDAYAKLRDDLAEELGADPGPEIARLHEAILRQESELRAPEPAPASRTNLPTPITDLIGRGDAVADVRSRLAAHRLVTLVGTGGVGKTRLAVEAATQVHAGGRHETWLVELGALDSGSGPGHVAEAIAAALGLLDVATPDRLAGALGRRRILLLLDNCEHLVQAAAEVAETVLRKGAEVRILATSREPLGLPGEVVWDVPPLRPPDSESPADPQQVLADSSAARLFVARAAAADRGFALTADTAPQVARLCRRLDGIPLALELAATRVRALGVAGVADRLDDRFRLLSAGGRGVPERQRTLGAVIDWSWELLDDTERAVLRRLAVHPDGCTVEAAEAVCADHDVPAAEVAHVLARLVDRSLLTAAPEGAGAVRYRLLESVAAYCAERLDEAGETRERRRRMVGYYVGFADSARTHLYGPGMREWLPRLDAEAANLRAALESTLHDGRAGGALRLCDSLAWYWIMRGRLTEAQRCLRAALRAADRGEVGDAPADVQARTRAWLAGIAVMSGHTADWERDRDAALSASAAAGDAYTDALVRWWLGFLALDTGDTSGGERMLDDSLAAFRGLGDEWGEATVLISRAKVLHSRSDLDGLARDAERALRLFRGTGDEWGALGANEWLGALAEMTGDLARAREIHTEGLRVAEELGFWHDVVSESCWLAWIATQSGDHEDASVIGERALRLAVEQDFHNGEVFARLALGFAARRAGRPEESEGHLRRLVDQPADQEGEPPFHLPMTLVELGFVAEQRGDAADALRMCRRALSAAHSGGNPRDIAGALVGIAGGYALAGEHGRAAVLLGAAADGRRTAGIPASAAEDADIARISARVSAALGAAEFGRQHEHGAGLGLSGAVPLADESRPVSGPPAG